ncbi:MAG: hypothetical protein HY691_10595 [Chloroflexi bacterium]|nr:hypothetical protein [Chloroflexota bacterium]
MGTLRLALGIPLGVLVFIALWMFLFSRLLLLSGKLVAPAVALLIALVILIGAALWARSEEPAGEHGQ